MKRVRRLARSYAAPEKKSSDAESEGCRTDADRRRAGRKRRGGWMDSISPVSEEVVGRVPVGTAEDVERAVVAAENAWPGWAALTPMQRDETRGYGIRVES